MTVMDRTMRYLTIITKVNMDSRPRIIDTETGKFYPISTFEDLKRLWNDGNGFKYVKALCCILV